MYCGSHHGIQTYATLAVGTVPSTLGATPLPALCGETKASGSAWNNAAARNVLTPARPVALESIQPGHV